MEKLPPEKSWKIRKEIAIKELEKTDDLGIKALYLGDKLSNIRSLYMAKQKFGKDMWQFFNQKDPLMHKWYYNSIVSSLSCFATSPAYKEFCDLVKKVFE